MTETLHTRRWPDWFTNGYAEGYFGKYLSHLAGQPDLWFLQIGAYAGDATKWLAENILTGEGSWLTDVDTWLGSDEIDHGGIDFDEVFKFYMQRRPANVRAFATDSDSYFRSRHAPYPKFDFIYIDGSHQTAQVLRDAVHAEAVLKPGGLLAFDDYMWGAQQRNIPRPAIDAFMRCYEETVDILEVGLQVWCRKKGSE